MKREYVGIDLHRRRSVIYRMDAAGKKLDCVRIDNDPMRFGEANHAVHDRINNLTEPAPLDAGVKVVRPRSTPGAPP